jgi:hypothetical protein
MNRRVFLKSAVTTCGVVVVGMPNIMLAADELYSMPKIRRGELRYHGSKTRGCAIPTYRGNHHDSFPQDLYNV